MDVLVLISLGILLIGTVGRFGIPGIAELASPKAGPKLHWRRFAFYFSP